MENEKLNTIEKEDKFYNVKIISIGSKGDGVAKIKGMAIFIKNTDLGEIVDIEITNIGKTYGFAKIIG